MWAYRKSELENARLQPWCGSVGVDNKKKELMDCSFAEGMDIFSWVKSHTDNDYPNSVVDECLQDKLT